MRCHLPIYGALQVYSEVQTKSGPRPQDPWIGSYRYHDALCTPKRLDEDAKGAHRRLVVFKTPSSNG